jgi:hypothetical protein
MVLVVDYLKPLYYAELDRTAFHFQVNGVAHMRRFKSMEESSSGFRIQASDL